MKLLFTAIFSVAFASLAVAQAVFEVPSDLATLSGDSVSQHAGDFDGDGHADVAVLHFATASISVLHGLGDGTFAPAVTIDLGFSPLKATSADFDGDGDAELLVLAAAEPMVAVFEFDGVGYSLLATFDTGASLPSCAAAADFDANGTLDLAIAASGDPSQPGTVTLFFADGAGDWSSGGSYQVGANPMDIAAADFDSSGSVDLVVACAGIPSVIGGEITWLAGDGGGGFLTPSSAYFVHAMQLAVADYDEDGQLDLAIVQTTAAFACGSLATILLGDGSGGFEWLQDIDFGCGPFHAVAGDFDRDGHVDLVLTDGGDFIAAVNELRHYPGSGMGSFDEGASISIASGLFTLTSPVLADFDEDLRLDLGLPSPSQYTVFLNRTVVSTPFQRGDVNDDATIDIADPVLLLNTLFSPGADPVNCDDAMDVNDDDVIDISDAVFELAALFSSGAPIPEPRGTCGEDPTIDALECVQFTSCP